MELNRENFDAVFPKLQHLLQTCEFYAFDLEMTGINPVRNGRRVDPELDLTSLPHNCRFYSTPEASWAGKWEAASTFSPMQLGLSIFHRRLANSSVKAFREKLTCKESSEVLDAWSAAEMTKQTAEALYQAAREKLTALRAAVDASVKAIGNPSELTSDDSAMDLSVLERVSRLYALMQELDMVEEFIINHSNDASGDKPPMTEYVASTFHCHLFPSWHYGDGELKMSIETVGDFLAKNNMDFNAWVRNSLLFAPREQITKKRLAALRSGEFGRVGDGTLGPKASVFNQQLLAKIPSKELSTVTTVFALLESFAEDNAEDPTARRPKCLPFLQEETFKVVIAKARSLGLKVSGGDVFWAPKNDSNHGVSTSNAAHQGTILIEAMLHSNKPVIAHNSWSDLLFLYKATHSTPLASYADFKTVMRQLFPRLYDTRTLCSLDVMQKYGTVRGPLDRTYDLFRKCHEAVTTKVTLSDGFAEGTKAAHNAGYDAFITGSLYLYIRHDLTVVHGIDYTAKLNGVIPVYASIFSIALHEEYDVLVQSRAAPIFYAIPDNTCRGGAFVEKLSSVLKKATLPAIVMNCGDSALAFVVGTAQGTGSLLDAALSSARHNFSKACGTRAQLIDMEVDRFVDKSGGKIQFLYLPATQ